MSRAGRNLQARPGSSERRLSSPVGQLGADVGVCVALRFWTAAASFKWVTSPILHQIQGLSEPRPPCGAAAASCTCSVSCTTLLSSLEGIVGPDGLVPGELARRYAAGLCARRAWVRGPLGVACAHEPPLACLWVEPADGAAEAPCLHAGAGPSLPKQKTSNGR